MAEPRPMVLRSVHLPPEMDEQLRSLAFAMRLSKADLIRAFVEEGLVALTRDLGESPSEQALANAALSIKTGGALPESQVQSSQETMNRMRVAAERSVDYSVG